MKKLIFLLALASISLSQINAQSLVPRAHKATTLISTNDAAGADTIKISPSEYMTILAPSNTITDTLCYKLKDISRCALGDEILVIARNSSGSGHKIKFVGTAYPWAVSGADTVISLTSSAKAVIRFVFDGYRWVESSKIVQ